MFPTKVIRWLFLGTIAMPQLAAMLCNILPLNIVLQSYQKSQLLEFAVAVLLICLVLALIILDYAILVKNEATHVVISQHRNRFKELSPRWLIQNLRSHHIMIILVIVISIFYSGVHFGKTNNSITSTSIQEKLKNDNLG